MAYTKKQRDTAKELILSGLSTGKSLKNILDNTKKTPSRATVYQWLNEEHNDFDKEFLNNYVQAREDSADLDAEMVQEIADKTLSGEYDPASARVALDAYKWSAGKKKPKKYGDKMDITSDGKRMSSNITVQIIEPDT